MYIIVNEIGRKNKLKIWYAVDYHRKIYRVALEDKILPDTSIRIRMISYVNSSIHDKTD